MLADGANGVSCSSDRYHSENVWMEDPDLEINVRISDFPFFTILHYPEKDSNITVFRKVMIKISKS
jgi:hypothetical protein